MVDLRCEYDYDVGPVDERVADKIIKTYGLDNGFVEFMKLNHGGKPSVGTFESESGVCRVALFLTLLDDDSELPGPFRPHFDDCETDERVMNSVSFVKECEHATSRALFSGLLPFAAMRDGDCLDRAYVDLLCFDCRTDAIPRPVVLWKSHDANTAYMDWEELPFEEQFDEEENYASVPWEDFLEPVANSFDEFVRKLKPND